MVSELPLVASPQNHAGTVREIVISTETNSQREKTTGYSNMHLYKKVVTLIVAYSLMLSGCKQILGSSSSSYLDSVELAKGVATDAASAEAILGQLSQYTQRWLQCRNYQPGQDCVELDYNTANLTNEERKRVWLLKLLEAKGRVSKEEMSIRTGIWMNKIDSETNELMKALKDPIKRLNAEYFRNQVGVDFFDMQLAYFLSAKNLRFFNSLGGVQRQHEIEAQMKFLRTMNPEFMNSKKNIKELYTKLMTNSSILVLEDPTEEVNAISESFI